MTTSPDPFADRVGERDRAASLQRTAERDREPLPFADGDHRSFCVMHAAG